ncbi:MAG: non-ribosomal peptide synthetase [Caulobacterales bacterium]|jgi:amino acid adenylation domain-containing protein|nr:non-ribosomal peptide synthetase [Caulobacterales bacterium]
MSLAETPAFSAAHAYPRNSTIIALFKDNVRATPHAIAVEQEGRTLSYAELDAYSNRLAAKLQMIGVGPGDIVALLTLRSIEAVAAMIATLKVGAAFTPLDPAYPRERLAFMLTDATPKALFAQADALDFLQLGFPAANTILLKYEAGDAQIVAHEGAPEDPAYLMYTSGSTGQPKGVIVPHRGVVRSTWRNKFVGISGPGDVVLHMVALSFDPSQLEIWGALANGGTLAILPDATPSLDRIIEAVKRTKANWTVFSTGIFHYMVEHNPSALASLRGMFIGGDVFSVQHADKAARAMPNTMVVNAYGPTENSVITTCFVLPPTGWSEGSVPIGEAVDHCTVYVMDEALREVADGETGELCTGGDGLALGYHNQPELTAQKFVRHPQTGERLYRTGDIVRRRPDGLIEFVGRNDRQVKLNGKRVELDEIEALLRMDDEVADAAAILREDTPGIKRLAAYLKPVEQPAPPAFGAAVIERLKTHAPAHLIPSDVVVMETFPLTPAGKLDRKALPAPRLDFKPLETNDDTERTLAEIWREVLGVGAVGLDDNFFDLGGTSLLLIRVHAKIQEKLSPEISLVALFETPKIRDLAQRLRKPKGEPDGAALAVKDRAKRQAEALARLRDAKKGRG